MSLTEELPYAATGLRVHHARLDALMDEAGVDVLFVTSKHSVRHLLGGYISTFFAQMDAVNWSRYLPILVYPRGQPQKTAYLGHRMEAWHQQNAPFWFDEVATTFSNSVDSTEAAIDYVTRAGFPLKRIGVEASFIPMDSADLIRRAFPDAEIVNAHGMLERFRAVKTPAELAKLRFASERVVESMMAVIAAHGPGTTKAELVAALAREEASRGLTFDYCLIAAGTSLNRAPSDQHWEQGDSLSLDSGGNYEGYIGDVARMGILGDPDAEQQDILQEVEEIQRAAFAVVRQGVPGREIYVAAEERIARSPLSDCLHFLAHGMGLVSHEAPRLAHSGPPSKGPHYGDKPLEAGMIVSIETEARHPRRGFIKLEDTLLVTPSGFEIFGEGGRGWNRGGTGSASAAA